MGPDIALAASARSWPDRLHRSLLDHGGGRVRARVMSSEQALASQFEVLFIDDVCSFLTPRLVRRLRQEGRQVVGVYSPEDGVDAKRRLLECGITDVVESDATPEEFIAIAAATLAHVDALPVVPASVSSPAATVAVAGAATGAGCTELAIALAAGLTERVDVVLVDLDQRHPSIAQRLDLPLHPNLRTAVDFAHHESGRLGEAIQRVNRMGVVGGLAVPAGEELLPRIELVGLIEDLAAHASVVVLDVGQDRPPVSPDLHLVVGEASPVGLTRLVRAVEHMAEVGSDPVVVANRMPVGRGRAEDVATELAGALPGNHLVTLPNDRSVGRASWDGRVVGSGPYRRTVGRLAAMIAVGVKA